MVDVTIDPSEALRLASLLNPAAQRAMRRAFRMEPFRLKRLITARLQAGEGPAAAALTQKEQKRPTSAALSAFGRFAAYDVAERGPLDFLAQIGVSKAVSRKGRNPEGKRRQLVALFGGGEHTLSKAGQALMAYKIRTRLGEPVRKPGVQGPDTRRFAGRRRRYATGARQWADIGAFLPKVGARLSWPMRDWVSAVVSAEGARSARNIAVLFSKQLRGQLSKKTWWNDEGEVAP